MGLLARWNKTPDPLLGVIQQLSQQLVDQRQDHKDQMDKLIGQIDDQNRLLKELVSQYINRGANTNESLHDRVERKDQYLKDSEWGPVTDDPFEGF
jgi:hypothetical protein